MTEEHLQLVERVFIIAGGVEKAAAIAYVLRKNLAGRKVALVTDAECARAALAL